MISFSDRGRVRGLAVIVAVACAVSRGMAQLQEGDALTPVIENLPLSTHLVVVSSKPSAVLERVEGPWKQLGPFATTLGGKTLKSWALLSRRLGYAPGEAFDALTSGGLAFVVAEPTLTVNVGVADAPAEINASWAVLTVVKGEVAARVRERLKAAPHDVVGGRPVLSVEEGRFALVCRGLNEAEGGDEVLALTPTEDRAFLESVVASVEAARPGKKGDGAAGRRATLGSTAAFSMARRTRADVLVLASGTQGAPMDAPAGERPAPWSEASVIGCALSERAWIFDIESVGADVKALPAHERVAPEAAAWFDAWGPGAAMMVVTGGDPELKEALGGVIPALLPERERLEGAGFFVGRHGDTGGRVSVWGGLRVSGDDRPRAPAMDAVGERLVRLAESGDWLEELSDGLISHVMDHAPQKQAPPGPGSYAAAGPMSLRVASVKVPPGVQFRLPGQDEPAPLPASVAWFQCRPSGAGDGEADPWWMAWGVEPTQDTDIVAERHRSLTRLLSRAGGVGSERAWLWRAVVRPPRVLEVMPDPMAFAAGLSGVGTVKEVRFEGWEEPLGERGVGVRSQIVVEWVGGGAAPVPR